MIRKNRDCDAEKVCELRRSGIITVHMFENFHVSAWIKENSAALFSCVGCFLLLVSPQVSVTAAKRGIELWLYTVTPSLLPFFIFTDMLMSSGVHTKIGRIFERPVSALLGVPGEAAFVFVSSILSGYPTGARLIGEMSRAGTLSSEEAEAMMNFCSTSGPLFIISAVGVGMLDSETIGFVILGAHCAGALLTGVILNPYSALNKKIFKSKTLGNNRADSNKAFQNRITNKEIKTRANPRASIAAKKFKTDFEKSAIPSFSDIISGAVLRSLKTIGLIGGFIVIFTVLTEYITLFGETVGNAAADDTGISIFTKSVNNQIIVNFANIISYLCMAASAVLEMTVGCSRVAEAALSLEMRAVICTFIISFGGLSVAAQTAGVLRGSDIKMRGYMYAKVLHGLISTAIVIFIFVFWQ